MLIICTQTGTVLELENCKLVALDSLTEKQQEPLWCGSDAEIIELANTYGKSFKDLQAIGFL